MSRTKPASNKVLTIRLPEADLNHLEAYCAERGKTKTEVILETIRRLKLKNPVQPYPDPRSTSDPGFFSS